MPARLIFFVLYLILAAAAFVLSVRQKREKKDFRLLQILGAVALILAVLKISQK